MRSRTGCLTCRQRKLKCDELKPVCSNCQKGPRECRPSVGVVFRHQQNASMNGAGEGEEENPHKLGGFYAYKNTFNENNTWVEVPKKVTFYHVTDPYNMEDTPEPECRPSPVSMNPPQIARDSETYFHSSGLLALSAAATATASSAGYMRPGEGSHSSNNLDFILNPTVERSSPLPQEAFVVDDHEVAFLLRHFGETTGQWMDLFDLECYFAHRVPVQALSNPLLRFSACAYAAKQLFRVRGRKEIVGGNVTRRADMELYPRPESVDWEYTGAKYYDKAISLLMTELSNTGMDDSPMSPMTMIEGSMPQHNRFHDVAYSPRNDLRAPLGKRRRLSRPAAANNADETLAAAAILCVYEFLDNANTAWARHLSGTKSLFDLAEREGMMPVQSPTSPGALSQRMKPSRARRATFWNFARQDFLAAFINEGQTRLNTADLGLWRAAGLQLDERGFVEPSNNEDSQHAMREDMISNALIFLMSKIVNYLASGDSVDNVFPQDPSSPTGFTALPTMVVLQRWKELEKELEIWHAGLPDTFKPCARLPPVTNGSVPTDSARGIFSEIWYSMPMCASTMQSYHMARTILLVNRPTESTARRSTLTRRHRLYGEIRKEIRFHVHEICGIALSRPDGSVRIHQVQPLFVAGQCMEDERERRIVLGLLREIEHDLGWATDYRIRQLLKEWECTGD